MKHLIPTFAVSLTLAVMALTMGVAQAQPVLVQRCQADALNPAAAEARALWARRCALVLHVGNPNNTVPAPPGALQEYEEFPAGSNPTGRNAYISGVNGFQINFTTVSNIYLSGASSQGIDSLGYFTWLRALNRKRPRPLYPTYGSEADLANPLNRAVYPHPTDSQDCFFYQDKAGTVPVMEYKFYVNGYCEATP